MRKMSHLFFCIFHKNKSDEYLLIIFVDCCKIGYSREHAMTFTENL